MGGEVVPGVNHGASLTRGDPPRKPEAQRVSTRHLSQRLAQRRPSLRKPAAARGCASRLRAMLIDDIKGRFKAAMKARNEVEREILRVAIGDITSRGEAQSDEDVQAVLRKLLKSVEETLSHDVSDEERAKLSAECEILRDFLPKSLTEAQVVEALAPVAEQIRAAQNDGQATGVAMKHLKGAGAVVEGKVVTGAVRSMRG